MQALEKATETYERLNTGTRGTRRRDGFQSREKRGHGPRASEIALRCAGVPVSELSEPRTREAIRRGTYLGN